MSLGERVRQLREARGWTRAELAARAGLTAPYISMLEAGKRASPNLETARRLAAALDVSVAELEGEPDILSGEFPAATLRDLGLTDAFLLRYARLWKDLPRDQRAWLIGHLRVMADAERRVRQWEAAADEDEPGGASFPTGTHGPPILTSVIT